MPDSTRPDDHLIEPLFAGLPRGGGEGHRKRRHKKRWLVVALVLLGLAVWAMIL